MVLSDTQILASGAVFPIAVSKPGEVSYGVSSYGYDIRLGRHFRFPKGAHNVPHDFVLDPKNAPERAFDEVVADDHVIIPAHGYCLAETVEHFDIPRDVLGVCFGKSTWARLGIIVNVTPLEPQWRGALTLEISNTTPYPCRLYVGEGIAQIVFLKADQVCAVSYADKRGKYQEQAGVTHAKV